MAPLPGPDRPRRPKKAKVPKRLIPLYARAPGRGIRAPAAPAVRRVGSPAGPAAAPAPGVAPAAGPSSLGPYAEYRSNPWAMRQLLQIDADQKAHQDYVTGTVAPWLSQGLTNLTGVDPSKPGINSTLQQQYLANVQGVVGGAMNAAATAGPAQVAPTTPGGMVASPTAYLSQAAREGAQGRASSMLQSAQIQSALNTMQPNTQAQGAMYALAAYAAGLPAVYAERRSAARSKIDQFIADQQQAQAQLQFDMAKQNEAMRHNRVTESISATNASTNAAFQAANLGLKANDQAFGQQADLTAASTPAPYGYVRDPATGDLKRDPSVPQASAAGSGGGGAAAPSAARGQYVPNKLRKEGFVGGWKVKPKGLKGPFVRATDGTWWRKPAGGSGASGPKPKAGSKSFDVQKDLTYSIDNGYIDTTDPAKGVPQLLRFLRKHQPSTPAAFNKWWAEILPVLQQSDDPVLATWIVGYKRRRELGRDGVKWKGLF